MKYITVVPKMRLGGQNPDGTKSYLGTVDIVRLIARSGKSLNTGMNVLIAKYIFDACCDTAGDPKDVTKISYSKENSPKYAKNYIELEDSWYQIMMQDLENFDFTQFGLVGLSFAEDIQNIQNATSEKPEDKEMEFNFDGETPA